jgi:MarR-like DNA-binding transcriptional regulator SgrR of sgrS sRNA
MKLSGLLLVGLAAALTVGTIMNTSLAESGLSNREIRTYLSISLPIDPSQVITLSDLEMSYALASTLVELDDSKRVRAGLAKSWRTLEDGQVVEFTLASDLQWANGDPLTAQEVKASFERARSTHPEDLKSLFDQLVSIDCANANTIRFHLRPHVSIVAILNKLTEPMYGVLRLGNKGRLDLSVTSGPFVVVKESREEIILRANVHWFRHDNAMPEQVVIRSPKANVNQQTVILDDPWPNLIASQSLMEDSIRSRLELQHFSIWTRALDRALILTPYNGRLANAEGFALLRYLRDRLDHKAIGLGLGGFTLADQFFPKGYSLHCNELKLVKEDRIPKLKRRLKILAAPERVPQKVLDNFSKAVEAILGEKPEYRLVPVNLIASSTKDGDYDLFFGSFGVGDPNYEGDLSYYFELTPPPIPPGTGIENFTERTVNIRKVKDDSKRLELAREMLGDVVSYGHILPLFHYSTIVMARPELDLSQIPATEESVSFSKVRFK